MKLLAALAFLTELAALVVLGAWGWRTGPTLLARSLLMLAAPLAFALFWGLFLSPKAQVALTPTLRLVLKALAFMLVALAAWRVWGGLAALAFGLAAALSLLADILQPRPA